MRPRRLLSTAALAAMIAACSAPVPEPDGEPQAAGPSALRGAIEAPLEQAHAVDATQAAEEAERQRVLEEAGG